MFYDFRDSDFVIPTTEELLGVIDEAMILAAEKKSKIEVIVKFMLILLKTIGIFIDLYK